MIREIKGRNWYCCPYCNKALFPVKPDARVEGLVLRCKACRHDVEVTLPEKGTR